MTQSQKRERVESKYLSWKKAHPLAGTLCVTNCDSLDFFSTGSDVSTILRELQTFYGLSLDESLNYLDAAQFSDDALF